MSIQQCVWLQTFCIAIAVALHYQSVTLEKTDPVLETEFLDILREYGNLRERTQCAMYCLQEKECTAMSHGKTDEVCRLFKPGASQKEMISTLKEKIFTGLCQTYTVLPLGDTTVTWWMRILRSTK